MNVALIVFCIVLPVQQQSDEYSQSKVEDAPEPRRFSEIKNDIKAFLKREATAETDADRMAAIRDLCRLFVEIKRDPRLPTQPALLGYKNMVWTRLDRVKKALKHKVPKETRSSKNQSQQTSEEQGPRSLLYQSSDEQIALLNQTMGGPASMVSRSTGSWGGSSIDSNARDLIDLIQTTIAPETWDVNGGNGSIVFYRQLNALVVRATSEVHHDFGRTLRALRRAGR